jgi:hypothetical protein
VPNEATVEAPAVASTTIVSVTTVRTTVAPIPRVGLEVPGRTFRAPYPKSDVSETVLGILRLAPVYVYIHKHEPRRQQGFSLVRAWRRETLATRIASAKLPTRESGHRQFRKVGDRDSGVTVTGDRYGATRPFPFPFEANFHPHGRVREHSRDTGPSGAPAHDQRL